jgi:hypothetical protein
VGVLALIVGIAIGSSTGKSKKDAGSGGGGTAIRTVTEVAQATTDSPTIAETPAEMPKPADFKIKVKIKKKECFGSAGCNLTYQIAPDYVGDVDISSGSYEVTYRVLGGEDGPQINTFTLDSGTASFDQEESISTPSSATSLRAEATAVDSG